MALGNSFPNDATTGQSVLDTRLTNSALVAQTALGQPRLGVVYDRPDRLVEATASMSYRVRDARFVTSRTGVGCELVANDGAVTVTTTTAPTSNTRIDMVYVRARFLANADGSAVPEIGVRQGVAAVNPTDPALPAGALLLARVRVPSGVTSTQAAGVVFEEVCPFTSTAGGTVVVRNLTELNAWKPGDGATAHNLADSMPYERVSGSWIKGLETPLSIAPGFSAWSGRLNSASVSGKVATAHLAVTRAAAIGNGVHLATLPFPPAGAFFASGFVYGNGAPSPLEVGADGRVITPSAGMPASITVVTASFSYITV